MRLQELKKRHQEALTWPDWWKKDNPKYIPLLESMIADKERQLEEDEHDPAVDQIVEKAIQEGRIYEGNAVGFFE